MCNTICILQSLRMSMISDKKDTRVSFSYYFFSIPRVSILQCMRSLFASLSFIPSLLLLVIFRHIRHNGSSSIPKEITREVPGKVTGKVAYEVSHKDCFPSEVAS